MEIATAFVFEGYDMQSKIMRYIQRTVFVVMSAAFLSCVTTRTERTQEPAEGSATVPVAANTVSDTAAVAFARNVKAALDVQDMQRALSLFDTMPRELADDVGLQVVHASILVSAGRYAEAQEIVAALERAGVAETDTLELSAMIAAASGDRRAERAAVQKILATDPTNAIANIQQAKEHALNKRYQLAAHSYERALKGQPDNTEALFGCAQMNYYVGKLKESEAYLHRLLELEPNNAYAFAYLGKLAADDENYLRASRFVTQAIAADGMRPDFYLDLGVYERYQGHFDAAEDAWTKAIALQPDYFLGYVYRGGLYSERENYSRALADYLKVVEYNPKYYFAYEEIGVLQWHAQNWPAARSAFLEALNYASNNYAYMLMVAATYLKEKNTVEAKSYLARAMRGRATNSLEYQMLRLYHDQGGTNAENNVMLNIEREANTTKKGKLRYYMGLYYDLKGSEKAANEFYLQATSIQAPLFFEYRLAEWGLER
ncbi:MAG: tetratricopeptide repeat protein [Treponema sp.]|nr:tetratricopeptide repeat protein [Treponema sp.]